MVIQKPHSFIRTVFNPESKSENSHLGFVNFAHRLPVVCTEQRWRLQGIISYLSIQIRGQVEDEIIWPREGIPESPPSIEDGSDVKAQDECQRDVIAEISAIQHHPFEHPTKIHTNVKTSLESHSA